jgi:hypothetical protein
MNEYGQWWNDIDRGKLKYWDKNIRWMNDCGALVEWYWQEKTEVLGEKHYTASVVDEWMSMEHWWKDTDRGKQKYWERNIISISVRWMNEYWALVEWYWQENWITWIKTCHSATLSTINLTWSEVRLNPGLNSDRLVTNHLTYGTA